MKKLFFVLSLTLILSLMSCSKIDYNNQIVEAKIEDINEVGDYYIFDSLEKYSAYLSTENGQGMILINSSLDFNQYNETYFKDKVLVFVVISKGSSSISYNIKNITLDDGVLKLNIKKHTPRTVNADYVVWMALIEMTKEEARNLVDTNVVLKNTMVIFN